MAATRKDLVWSSQFSVIPSAKTPHLKGDKIVLPPSALEELLSAATVRVSRVVHPQTSSFDPYNPYSFAAEREARSEILETQQQLPHPLTFRLVNPKNGRVIFAGIREFSADEQRIGLSPFLRHSLGIEDPNHLNGFGQINSIREDEDQTSDGEVSRITVHVKELPKGTYVRLRPLEAGYDAEDWKALLEQYLRDNFTTLTKGEILSVPAGSQDFQFLVDQLRPSDEAVSLVDTDLEVNIEALNEEQARETLNKRLRKAQRPPGTAAGSSSGGPVEVDRVELGQVRLGDYVDYTLETKDSKDSFEVRLTSQDAGDALDLFVSPFGPRQRSRPRENEYVFGDLSGFDVKKIRIPNTHSALDNADALWVSVRGYKSPDVRDGDTVPERVVPYQLQITRLVPSLDTDIEDILSSKSNPPSTEEDRCKNCRQWVPRATMMLHENFCYRNNILCPQCDNIFQKSSVDWKTHWHCPSDDAYGNTKASQGKHNILFHTFQTCASCNYPAANVPGLAQHRTTTCPDKLILCSFCHLQVPQQGPGDPDVLEPEVIFSGLTPHELIDGARTTECHLCAKIERLRDMPAHLKLHDFQRRSRPKPRICRNANCGRTVDGLGKNGQTRNQPPRNELRLCDTCFGPLYVTMYDPDGKALKRRVERKYLTQLLTGCGQAWCRNEYCTTGRQHLGLVKPGEPITSKEALIMIKPVLEKLKDDSRPVHFCTDEASQKRRTLAGMVSAEGGAEAGKDDGEAGDGAGYGLEWCVAAFEVEAGDLDRARAWLKDWAPTRAETARS
jgi:hypothetical protein